MNDLISRQDAIDELEKLAFEMKQWSELFQIQAKGVLTARNIIESLPSAQTTADVVEVVRCKDCKWQDKGKNECESWNMCRHNVIEYFTIYDEHFCEWGERREDERKG